MNYAKIDLRLRREMPPECREFAMNELPEDDCETCFFCQCDMNDGVCPKCGRELDEEQNEP